MLQLLVDSSHAGGCCVDAAAAQAAADAPAGARRVRHPCGVSKLQWLEIIADLALTESQITRVLEMRTEALRTLNRCFGAREALAVKLLAEAGATGAGGAGGAAASTAGSWPGGSSGSGGAGAVAGCCESGGCGSGATGLTAQADKMRRAGYLAEVARTTLTLRELLADMQVRGLAGTLGKGGAAAGPTSLGGSF
jgi:hypothetical protein